MATSSTGLLAEFAEAGALAPADVHAAETIVDAAWAGAPGQPTLLDYLAVAVAVWAPRNGHVCADLTGIGDRIAAETRGDDGAGAEHISRLAWPEPQRWLAHLAAGPLVGPAVGPLDTLRTRPLVCDGTRVYLTRQWIDEGEVAARLGDRLRQPTSVEVPGLEDSLAAIFGNDDDREDRQRRAVRTALTHRTSVILGGPGTGKTYTITAILHAALETHARSGATEPLRVALAAPTAKAAKQIAASIGANLDNPDFPVDHVDRIRDISKDAGTMHRLLGWVPESRGRFAHRHGNLLPYDLVIIDETSMVSLPLMSRLLEALAPKTRLVLVGDPGQLQSVEQGAVLPDIAAADAATPGTLPVTTLTVNRRQAADDGVNAIGRLAEVIRSRAQSSPEEVIGAIRDGHEEILWVRLEDAPAAGARPEHLPTHRTWVERIDADLAGFRAARDAAHAGRREDALGALATVRVLCAHRTGPHGVSEWNGIVARAVGVGTRKGSVGQPLVNTRNDLRTGLVNGDNGIVISEGGCSVAVFDVVRQAVDPELGDIRARNEIAAFDPSALEDADISFATTVHKAQGSQYDTTIVIVPPRDSPLATLELLYTAVTRARTRLVIVGSEAAIRAAVSTTSRRESGLAARLLAPRSAH